MVETQISQNTKTNYGRNRNIIEYKNELWQKQKYHINTQKNELWQKQK